MEPLERAVCEGVAALNATGAFRYASHPVCTWNPRNQEHHLHVPGPGYGNSHQGIYRRIAMAAVSSGWDVTVLDPGLRQQWLQHLPRVTYIDDPDHNIAWAWLLTEPTTIDNSNSMVFIPDYADFATTTTDGQQCEIPAVKQTAQTHSTSPHIVLGLGAAADATEHWRTTTISDIEVTPYPWT